MNTYSWPAHRRHFLKAALGAGAASVFCNRILPSQSSVADPGLEATLARDPMRPQFHLLPACNWMNDPNGPIYVNGKYHMFFQYNPQGAVWGNMSWNHAVSPDMLHWTHDPIAFTMTPNGPDAAGCFSGSAIAVGKRVYAVYTGVVKNATKATIPTEGLQESQCLAWSDDPALKQWTKLPSPIIPLPPANLKVTGFRDPSVWQKDGWYYMTVGSGVEKIGGCVLIYRSQDLKSWEYLHELVSGTWNDKPTPNPCDDGEMWECPEFFSLDGGHVLIYSTLGKVFWQSGMFDIATLKFYPQKTGVLDLDAFYAPKTQLDARGRRILWGWIPERRSEDEMRKAGWSGMMSLPRLMTLDRDGTLRLQILPEAAALRSGKVTAALAGSERTLVLAGASGEVHLSANAGGKFEFKMNNGTTEILSVRYSPETRMIVADEKEIPLSSGDVPELHAFVDGSVIELIVSQRVGYTKRFYYKELTAPDIRVRVKGEGVVAQAWKIAPISNNRLTTPAFG